jgi:aspartyl protease
MSAAKHSFSYRFVDDSKFIRPYIPVGLRSKNSSIPSVLALVDSGADFCMFDGELASVLDVDLPSLQQVKLSGINGSVVGYVAHLEISVNDHFIPVPVVFSFDFSPVGFGGIIGQVGFFDAFKVQFDRTNRAVHLT